MIPELIALAVAGIIIFVLVASVLVIGIIKHDLTCDDGDF